MALLTSFTNLAIRGRNGIIDFPASTIRLPQPAPAPQPVVRITPIGPNGVVPGSSRTRPLWFDGRFLAAQDLQRDQKYFLQGEATLAKAAGFGIVHGLAVTQAINAGQPDPETIVIEAGQGITPGGDLVMLSDNLTVRISDIADEEDLDVEFGLSEAPDPIMRTRTGLYVLALRPVEFTANPITSYPSSIQGSRATQDGSVIEATAVSMTPYPIPLANYDSTTQNAAAARQVFVEQTMGALSNSLLPVAMIGVERGVILWVDQWMVRRESGPEFNGLRFGLAEIATAQAYLRQFDAQLQQIVAPMVQANAPANFPATAYFQALPPAGRFPVGAIDPVALTQVFFPQQTNVTLSLVPEDELAALIDDSMSLPPIDLTLPASAYADLAVWMLVPLSRAGCRTFAALQPVTLSSPVPLAVSLQNPLDILRFFQLARPLVPPDEGAVSWRAAIGSLTYGYFVRRRSVPAYISFTLADTATALATAAVAGSPATQYTATVTPSTATGTVIFNDGAAPIGTVDVQAGVATLVLPNLAAGAHSLTAVYQGDINYSASASPVVTLTVPGT
jgi:hypothetical protein